MRLSLYRWLFPVPSAFVLQAIYGLLFADGVFVSILNDVTLTKAIGLLALFSALGITLFGILLANDSDSNFSQQMPRFLAILGSLAISAQALMAYGLYIQSSSLVYTGSIIVGIGSGAVYVVSIIVLQDWVPESPGMVTGFGLLLGGAGSLFGIYAFQVLTDALASAITAMALSGLVAGAVSVLAAVFIKRPPTGWNPLAEKDLQQQPLIDVIVYDNVAQDLHNCTSMYNETKSLLPHKHTTEDDHLGTAITSTSTTTTSALTIVDILCDPAFSFVFISVFAAVGPGFGFVIAFPRMVNVLFAIDFSTANSLLFWVSAVSVLGRICIGLAIDLQSSHDASGAFSSSKQMNTWLLAIQSSALALMPLLIRYGWIKLFAIATALVLVTFNGGAVVSACLARSVFTSEQSTLAFALLGIAIGVGRALFSIALASCGGGGGVISAVQSFGGRRVHEYDYYMQLAFIVSAFGLVMSYYVTPSRSALEEKQNKYALSEMSVV